MSQQNVRSVAVVPNVTVAPAPAGSTKLTFEEFGLGAVFVPPGVSGSLLWWGGGQNTPAGVNQAGASTYPANTTTGLSDNFAPVMNAAGQQVSQNVNGGGTGAWYPIPAECAGLGALKLTSSTVGNVTIVLKS